MDWCHNAVVIDFLLDFDFDSDYIDLVKHLKSEGVRIEIAAIEETTSAHLKEEVDYYHPITKEDIFTLPGKPQKYNPKKKSTRKVAKKSNRKKN